MVDVDIREKNKIQGKNKEEQKTMACLKVDAIRRLVVSILNRGRSG